MDLGAPQEGQVNDSGTSSHEVPGIRSLLDSPFSGSYIYPQTLHFILSLKKSPFYKIYHSSICFFFNLYFFIIHFNFLTNPYNKIFKIEFKIEYLIKKFIIINKNIYKNILKIKNIQYINN